MAACSSTTNCTRTSSCALQLMSARAIQNQTSSPSAVRTRHNMALASPCSGGLTAILLRGSAIPSSITNMARIRPPLQLLPPLIATSSATLSCWGSHSMNKKNLSKNGYLAHSTTNLAGGCMKNLDLSRAGSASSPRLRALSVSLILALSACSPGANLAELPPVSDPDYHIGPGDQVRVITYDEPQLTNTFTVDADGTVSIPLVGAIHASGLTSSQLASAITSSLSGSKLISQPSVSVEIAAYRTNSVLDEVNHPGQYPYQ